MLVLGLGPALSTINDGLSLGLGQGLESKAKNAQNLGLNF